MRQHYTASFAAAYAFLFVGWRAGTLVSCLLHTSIKATRPSGCLIGTQRLFVPDHILQSSPPAATTQTRFSAERYHEDYTLDNADAQPPFRYEKKRASFKLFKKENIDGNSKSKRNRLRNKLRRKGASDVHLDYAYDYDVLTTGMGRNPDVGKGSTIGVMLIHPIGVGIGRWYHHRLFHELQTQYQAGSAITRETANELVVVSPDLLGSSTACNPVMTSSSGEVLPKRKTPLLNITDWSDQLSDLMTTIEEQTTIDKWCVVTNGGCSPIALQIAADRMRRRTKTDSNGTNTNDPSPVSNVVLSSVPRLSFFRSTSDPVKVRKSYRTLRGILGKAFWWYSLRNDGAFIQTFSERNLCAKPENLGPHWKRNCVDSARLFGGRSRYSTFAFLAGALRDGCVDALATLLDSDSGVEIDLIRGGDPKVNRAKSWFWETPKQNQTATSSSSNTNDPKDQPETFRQFLQRNGKRARETTIGGRISVAHEDAAGYARALLAFIG